MVTERTPDWRRLCELRSAARARGIEVSLDNASDDGPDGEDNVRSDIENVTIVANAGVWSNDTISGTTTASTS